MEHSTSNNNRSLTINKIEFINRLLAIFSSIDQPSNDIQESLNQESLNPEIKTSCVEGLYQVLDEVLIQQVNWDNKLPILSFHKLLKTNYATLLNDFPSDLINLITLIDKLFDYILNEKHLQKEMKLLMAQLRPAFFKLALTDLNLFTELYHPGRTFFNEMTKVALLWSANDPKTSIVSQQLNHIISGIINTQSENMIEQVFKSATEELNFFSIGFIKKIEIFEKRIRESEEGKARTEAAKQFAQKALNQILPKKNIPGFVSEFYSQVWEHVIFLEHLKGISEEQGQAFLTAKQLAVSLQPIRTEDSLNKQLELLSNLIKRLELGLSKTALSHSEATSFVDNLCHYHKNLISVAKSLIEKEKQGEDIIRLKPINQIHGVNNEEPINEAEEANINEMNLAEWVEYTFNKIPEISHDQQPEILEAAQNNNGKIQASLSELLITGHWFELMINGISSRCKLASYIEQNDKYIFVSGSGSKLAEFDSQAIQQAYDKKELLPIDDSPLFERAFSLVSTEAKFEKQKIEKQKQLQEKFEAEQRKLKEQETIRLEEIKNIERLRRIKEKELLAKKEADLIKNENQKIIQDVSQLSIGSWVEIKINDNFQKCRLAAKISSTGKYIFVDRSGVKIKELYEQDLTEFYETGQIKVKQKSDVFEHALSSLISNMRDQKDSSS